MLPIEAWRDRGRMMATADGRVFCVDARPTSSDVDPCPVLVLHGFPTSSWDFAPLAEKLVARRRVVLFDFLGYGLSDKPVDYGYSLFEQTDVAQAVAKELKLERVHLFAHDMGTSVATELLARRERKNLPFEIASLTLMNGSVHIEMAHLTFGQQLLKSPVGNLF